MCSWTTKINALEQPLQNNPLLNSHDICSWTTQTNALEQPLLNNDWRTLRKYTVEQPRWNNRAGTPTINTREQPLRNIHINYAGTASLEHPRWNSVRRNTHSGTAKKNALEQRKSSLFHFQSSLFQRVFYGWTRDGWTSARCSNAWLSLFQGKFVAVPEHLHQCDEMLLLSKHIQFERVHTSRSSVTLSFTFTDLNLQKKCTISRRKYV